jgi:hypothetical protein
VRQVDSSYPVARGGLGGWFTTGQPADIMLSGVDFNRTGGALLFNHPSMIASDGTRLLITDRNNNRVLLWNTLPAANTPPDVVLGQPDFDSNPPGTGRHQMNWPFNVAIAQNRVFVADTYNNRILIWTSVPVRHAQPADIVINGRVDTPSNRYGWPWGLWSDGTKLAVSWTSGGVVHIWNRLPAADDQPPDLVLTARGMFGTPRNITSNGEYLLIADHNAKLGAGQESVTFVWRRWPVQPDSPYDFVLNDWRQGTFGPDGRLFLLGYTTRRLGVWRTPPVDAGVAPDFELGAPPGFMYQTGDGSGVAIAGGRLYVLMSNGNRAVVYNTVPASSDARPDFAIGSPDVDTSTFDTQFFITNPVTATDGRRLFVSSDFDRRLYVWNDLPDRSAAFPNWVYSLPEAPWDSALSGDTLVLAGKTTVYVWTKLPVDGGLPSVTFSRGIGTAQFAELRGVAWDGCYFCLSDYQAGKLWVWNGLPDPTTSPAFTFSLTQPGRLSSDGQHLAVVHNGATVGFYNLSSLSASSAPVNIAAGGGDPALRFNLPGKVTLARGGVFVADTNNSRVQVWSSVDDALAGRSPSAILGEASAIDLQPEIGRDKLFWPAVVAFDGSYAWVGEFKFSGRILRFSVH